MYIQIKMYQREAAYRKEYSLGKLNKDINASLHMALGIFTLEISHTGRAGVSSRLRLP